MTINGYANWETLSDYLILLKYFNCQIQNDWRCI